MRARLLLVVAVLAALASGAIAAHAAQPTNECNGIRECQRAVGPWVVVPAHGWAEYLLDCPGRRGIVAGLDSLTSSNDVHVHFLAQIGAPIAPGRTTTTSAFFRAISATHRRSLFQPRVGCIPNNPTRGGTVSFDLASGPPPFLGAAQLLGAQRTTTAVHAVPGPPFVYAATNLKLRPGVIRTVTIGCVPGQKLAYSWTAVGFRTVAPPPVALADAIQVKATMIGKQVSVAIAASEALPRAAAAEVQLGVMCSS